MTKIKSVHIIPNPPENPAAGAHNTTLLKALAVSDDGRLLLLTFPRSAGLKQCAVEIVEEIKKV